MKQSREKEEKIKNDNLRELGTMLNVPTFKS